MIIEFENWLKLQGKSTNTIANYCPRVDKFLKAIENEFTQEKINSYFLSLQVEYTNKTINCYRDAIGAYIKFKNLGLILPPPLKTVDRIPDAINIEEFETIIIAAVEEQFQKVEKVKAIFYLLMYSGLRPGEVAGLKRKDIDLKNCQGFVYRQKNRIEDIFIFTEKVAALMKIYFLDEEEESNAFNITARGIGMMCEKIKADCPNIHLRPYLFRHSSATRLLEEGFNLIEIQNFLGHRSSGSVQKYLRVTKDGLKKKYLERIK